MSSFRVSTEAFVSFLGDFCEAAAFSSYVMTVFRIWEGGKNFVCYGVIGTFWGAVLFRITGNSVTQPKRF